MTKENTASPASNAPFCACEGEPAPDRSPGVGAGGCPGPAWPCRRTPPQSVMFCRNCPERAIRLWVGGFVEKWVSLAMGGSGSCGSGYPGSVMETAEEKVARVELENAQLRDRVARLAERPGELERRPGLNGGNSGKPPSSDGLKKPAAERRTRSLRGKTGGQAGGQAGHEGRTLCRTGRPDRVKEHVPAVCRGCGASLRSASAVGCPVARRAFDLPEPRPPEVTEHRGHACRCGRCGEVTRASFPRGIIYESNFFV